MKAFAFIISLFLIMLTETNCFANTRSKFSEPDWTKLVYEQKYDEAASLLNTEIENCKHGTFCDYTLSDLLQFKLTLQELRKDKSGTAATFEELLTLLRPKSSSVAKPASSINLQFCYMLDSYKIWLRENNLPKADTFMVSEYTHCKQTSAYKPKWAPDVDAGCIPDSNIDTTNRFEAARGCFGLLNDPYPSHARIIMKQWKPAKLFQSPVVLVIVGKQGEVKNCHLLRSLGNAKLDSEAVQLIKELHFSPNADGAFQFDLRFLEYSISAFNKFLNVPMKVSSLSAQSADWAELYSNGIRELRAGCLTKSEQNLSRALNSLGKGQFLYEKALTLDGLCSVYQLEDKPDALETSLKKLITLCRERDELDMFLPQALKTYSDLMEVQGREIESQWLYRQGEIVATSIGEKHSVQTQWYKNYVLSTIKNHIDISSAQKRFQALLVIDMNGFPKQVAIVENKQTPAPSIDVIALQNALLNLRFVPLPKNLSKPLLDPGVVSLTPGVVSQQLASRLNAKEIEPIAVILVDVTALPKNSSQKKLSSPAECTKYKTFESELQVLKAIAADAQLGVSDQTSATNEVIDAKCREFKTFEDLHNTKKLQDFCASILFALAQRKTFNLTQFVQTYRAYRTALYQQSNAFEKLTSSLNVLKTDSTPQDISRCTNKIFKEWKFWTEAVKQTESYKTALDNFIGARTANELESWLLLTGVYKTAPGIYKSLYSR